MNLSFSQNIKTDVSDETYNAIFNFTETEFKKISQNVVEKDNSLEAAYINASFGSILRKDISTIRKSHPETFRRVTE